MSQSKRVAKTVHTALIAALVDFHKIQCFFASTIQIAALILFQESQSNSAQDTNSVQSSFQDFFDTSILIALATSGFVPISLTLACISRYGRQSWYLLILSLITMLLATATLASSYIYARDYGIPYDLYASNMKIPYLYNDDKYNNVNTTSTTCNIRGSVGDSILPLCGSSNLGYNAIGSSTVANHWMWAIWANCIVWLIFCMAKHWYDSEGRQRMSDRQSIGAILANRTWIRALRKELCTYRVWVLLSVVTWSLCFGCQLYLFSAYFNHAVISKSWTFGQIISVTVWVPSVVEYIYIEYSKLKSS